MCFRDETVEHWCEGYKLTWDEKKAKENLAKHERSFELACRALLNPVNVAEEQEEESKPSIEKGVAVLPKTGASEQYREEFIQALRSIYLEPGTSAGDSGRAP